MQSFTPERVQAIGWRACFKVDRGSKSAKDTDNHVNSTQQVLWTDSPEDEEGKDVYTSGDAVAARNGLWVTQRCRPYCAAAVKPGYTTRSPRHSSSGYYSVTYLSHLLVALL
ncbi:hypothetical protein PAMA_003069 [Pampus argenteus]